MPDLKASLRAEAARLGLHRLGFARPDMTGPAARLADWLAKGHAGEMAYIGRRASDRADPGRLLAGCASVLAATEPYADAPAGEVFAALDDPSRAYFARYARGADYHEVLQAKLEALAAAGRRLAPGAAFKVYVDTGPVLEKDLGTLAGLGWRGKHSNLIDPRGGNWLFLGVVLTDLELAPDAPLPDRCGSCTRCLDACPTNAFPAPYVLDARRCISYLTIELKGPIPPAFRPAIGNRVFGCDDCLAVCPWNRFAARARETAYAARAVTAGATLAELMGMDAAAFARHFKGTPVARTKRRGLLRNVAVALGNAGRAGDPQAAPALEKALTDPEPLVRGHAAWALGHIGGPEARAALGSAARSEAEPYVRGEIGAALSTSTPGAEIAYL
jgi:epoxyqueuosine reductase